MTVIDDYFEKIDDQRRKKIERIRRIGKNVVPNAEETISYGMPTLKYKGHAFLGFDIHKNHIGIYPYGGEEISLSKRDLSNFKTSKGAIQIPLDKEISESLLKKIIVHRISRINKVPQV